MTFYPQPPGYFDNWRATSNQQTNHSRNILDPCNLQTMAFRIITYFVDVQKLILLPIYMYTMLTDTAPQHLSIKMAYPPPPPLPPLPPVKQFQVILFTLKIVPQ